LNKLNVIYIAGVGRSGSTILDQMLGQIPGICSLGEVAQLWQKTIPNNAPCGCGTVITQCPLWGPVLKHLLEGPDSNSCIQRRIEILELDKTFPRFHRLFKTNKYVEAYVKHMHFLQKLYTTVQERTNAIYLVDSSKESYYASLINRIPNMSLHVIHLVRNPLGYAYSLKKTKWDPAQNRLMCKRSPVQAAGRWLWVNSRVESLRSKVNSFTQVKYEDLIARPRKLLVEILQAVGYRRNIKLDFINNRVLKLKPTHSAAGNPCRYKKHEIHLSLDEEWKTHLNFKDRYLANILTLPLARKYSYFTLKKPLK